MRTGAPLVVAGLVLGCCAGGSLAADTPAAAPSPAAFTEVLGLLAARRHGHVAFTEVHELAMLKKPVQSSGELLYEAPDRLEKRTLEPRPESLVLAHGVLTVQRGHHQHVIALADAPQVVPFVESVRASLAGDRAALEHYFSVAFEGDVAHWRLTLLPRDPALARSVQEVRIEGEEDAIRTVEIRESDGDHSLVTIGPELPP